MLFSVNLTTQKSSKERIVLKQRIKFTERMKDLPKETAKSLRKQKQLEFVNLLVKLGFTVNSSNEVYLGSFNPTKGEFLDTTAEKFLQDFVIISILKGHFQQNKGYNLKL